MQLIQTVTVGSGGANPIAFDNIPQTYTDLLIVVSGRSTYSNVDDYLVGYFNASTTGYSGKRLWGTGNGGVSTDSLSSTVASGAGTRFPIGPVSGNTATASTFGSVALYIPNYSASSNKSTSADGVAETNGTTVAGGIYAGLWSSSAAITKVTIETYFGGTLVQGSTASLYGITKGSGGATVS